MALLSVHSHHSWTNNCTVTKQICVILFAPNTHSLFTLQVLMALEFVGVDITTVVHAGLLRKRFPKFLSEFDVCSSCGCE